MVHRADLVGVVGGVGVGDEIAPGGEHLDTGSAYGLEVLPSRDEVHLHSRPVECGPHIRADGAGAKNSDLHAFAPFSRRIVHSVYSMENFGSRSRRVTVVRHEPVVEALSWAAARRRAAGAPGGQESPWSSSSCPQGARQAGD
ncbi:hypothetical protein GCM10012278_90330 [Nonomuraea glycinis]|uniref:Uncharacterized protein n=1 Tax=Nonomuraea glycinis TaxID=2047744 RepID=A0A918EBH1_9ACTN|nr:hypothetical protein GCM10012278_90330 [Nonomuraea glycinis]